MPTLSIALASLSIQDFRGIESLELDFHGPDGNPNQLVVLAGPNGCGKTAVLEAGLLAASWSEGSKLVTGPTGRRAIRYGSKLYRIRAQIQVHGQEKRAKSSFQDRCPNLVTAWPPCVASRNAKKAKSSLQARCPNHFRCMKSGRFGTFLPGECQRLSVR